MPQETDVLVIGASASGLASAACVKAAGRRVEILEAGDSVGGPWRRHYDRLHLHTPRSISAMPGLPMPRTWPRYPSRDQVIEYLEAYRRHHRLEPHFGRAVTRLERDGTSWVATAGDQQWRARDVVIATGLAGRPVVPSWPGLADFGGEVLHSSEFRNGERWRGRSVLVVGFGNSGCEQAIDLVEHGAHPVLSVRSPVNVIPRDVAGVVPILRLAILMRRLPVRVADALSWPVIRLAVGDIGKVGLRKLRYGPFTEVSADRRVPLLDIGTMKLIRDGRIGVRGDISRFTADSVVFDDGTDLPIDAVVMATGYHPVIADSLTDAPNVLDANGVPKISGGPTGVPGLYFCGYHVAVSGMLREIAIEARQIADHIAAGVANP